MPRQRSSAPAHAICRRPTTAAASKARRRRNARQQRSTPASRMRREHSLDRAHSCACAPEQDHQRAHVHRTRVSCALGSASGPRRRCRSVAEKARLCARRVAERSAMPRRAAPRRSAKAARLHARTARRPPFTAPTETALRVSAAARATRELVSRQLATAIACSRILRSRRASVDRLACRVSCRHLSSSRDAATT